MASVRRPSVSLKKSKQKRTRATRVEGAELVREVGGHTDYISHLAWSPDGTILASASADGTTRLWDSETGECVRTLKGHAGPVHSVSFSTHG